VHGNDAASWSAQLAGVVGMDLDENGALVVDLILACAVELPAQVPVYATLAGLLSVETKAFGPQVEPPLVSQRQPPRL
jgi:hypothetical protein